MIDELLYSEPSTWQVQQIIAFDWYDGARDGFCWLIEPTVEFHFKLLDERPTEEDLDDRLYSISELPKGTCKDILQDLLPLGEPAGKVWCPIWQHSDLTYLRKVEAKIDTLIERATPTSIVIYSRNMTVFLGCWKVIDDIRSIDDWFSYFEL